MAVNFANSLLEFSAKLVPMSVYPRLIQRDMLGVFYHVVSDDDLGYIKHLYPVIPTEHFRESLDYLEARYSFVDYEQIHRHVLEGGGLPPNPMHITVDDGYRQCYDVIRPILKERNIPAIFFLTTSLIDNQSLFFRNKASLAIDAFAKLPPGERHRVLTEITTAFDAKNENLDQFRQWIKSLRSQHEKILDETLRIVGIDIADFLTVNKPYMTRDQIRSMHEEGFTMGAHTITHRKLGTIAPDEAKMEIVESCRIVREITGQEIVPLSFPNSGAGLSRQMLQDIRREYPWIGLFFDIKGLNKDIPIVLNRIWGEWSPNRRGDPLPIRSVIRRAYREQLPVFVKSLLREESLEIE